MNKRKALPWRLYHVGDYFTDLALEILGGEKTAGSRDYGDIDNWYLDAQIEVKGCSNRNTLKIYKEQLERQLSDLGFPFSNLLYAIFFYRNQWWDKTRSMSNETPTRAAMDIFLGNNIMRAFIVDGRVLAAIKEINGIRTEQHAGETHHSIRMSQGTLVGFIKKPEDTLKKFGLRDFKVFSYIARLKFRGQVINFELTFILHKKQLKNILDNFQLPLELKTQEEIEEEKLVL